MIKIFKRPLTNTFITKLKILGLQLLKLLKYFSFVAVLGFFIYEARRKKVTILSNYIHKNIKKDMDILDSSYVNIKNIPATKTYTYHFQNQTLMIKFAKRIPLFTGWNHLFDEEGLAFQEPYAPLDQEFLIAIKGDNRNFLPIYELFKGLFKIYDKKNLEITFEYVSIRWNMIIKINHHTYTIKLPTEIDEKTIEKIKYIFQNKNSIFNTNYRIIDLRFEKKIYLVK